MKQLTSVDEVVHKALQEDLGTGDITAKLIPEDNYSKARLLTREDAVLCGIPWFNSTFQQLDEHVNINWSVGDGDEISTNQEICRLEGPTRTLLTGERTAINFIQTLSGTATVVRQYAKILEDTKTKLLDTRKTIPGLREAQKYAVRCGGGSNHRLGLYDGILIKENHIIAAGSLADAVQLAKQQYPEMRVEVEVESIAELRDAITANVDVVLLDNFTHEAMREAVAISNGQVQLEASGEFDLASLQATAETGVDYISVGALTKHVRAIDFSMLFIN